jgi:hypothetical protein
LGAAGLVCRVPGDALRDGFQNTAPTVSAADSRGGDGRQDCGSQVRESALRVDTKRIRGRGGLARQAPALRHARHANLASCLGIIERFFRDISTGRIRRGVFTGVGEFVAAIDEYIAHHNTEPKPFISTKSAPDILRKVIRANKRLRSKQNAALH